MNKEKKNKEHGKAVTDLLKQEEESMTELLNRFRKLGYGIE